MHARRSILGPPGAKEASLPGPDEQLELYGASDTPLVRTDRLAPVSFAAPALVSRTRTHPAPHFQPPPAIDYSAELQLAELLMSDTDDSLGQLTHLTLSAMVPNRAQHSKAKFANAPSRVHSRPSNSRFDMRFSSRSMPLPSPPAIPSLSWSSSSNNSSPATVSTRLSVDHVSTDHSLSQPEHDVRPVNPNPKHEERSSPPARSPITEQSVSPSNMSSTTTATTTPTPTTTTTKQRSARPNRRSPAPRRQECTTCGKKFQRPCQLVTHIRSHTGEQPHACPVCSRRFSVLSNCQRHVKLCQKRSAKVLNPSEDDLCADSSGTVTSFIQFPGDTCPPQPALVAETAPRRSHEVPIRPKLISRESGSTGSIGSIGSAAPAPSARRQNRAGSSSSVDSPAPKLEAPSMPPSLERSGSGSTVPVVVPSSSAYPTSSYGYPPPNAYSQGAYDSSGSAFNNAYTGYSAPSSGYVQVGAASASGFKQNNAVPNFEAASAAAYDSLNPGFSAVPAYGSASPGYDRPESGFSQPYKR